MLRDADVDGVHLRAGLPATLTARRVLGTVLAVLALAPGCSGGSGPNAGSGLELVDYAFRPDAIAAAGGRQITLKVTNRGKVPHNLTIPAVEAGVDFQPGESTNLIFVVPESGPVEFYCKFHRDRGMTGAIILRRSPPT